MAAIFDPDSVHIRAASMRVGVGDLLARPLPAAGWEYRRVHAISRYIDGSHVVLHLTTITIDDAFIACHPD